MKIAIITDIHHGPQSHTKEAGWDALKVMRDFVWHAGEQGADLVLDLGDRISDTNRETDRQVTAEVAEVFRSFTGPHYHLLGNHDVNNLTIEDSEEILDQSMQSQVIDLGDLRLVLWQPGVKLTRGVGFPEAASGLPWLVEALNADERPAIIATHVPLSGHSQVGNYYFERNPEYSTYPDNAAVLAAVEATGKAALWLSGHVHWNTLNNVRGLPHLTMQSVSERFTTYPHGAAAFAMLEIADGRFSIDVHGNDPFHARLPFRKSGDRPWMPPLAPFEVPAEQRQAELESA
ncbi:MAG: metallophosphoesterase [Candidatus Omnitrophota bacterium]|jgi:predicted phosphodiesterase